MVVSLKYEYTLEDRNGDPLMYYANNIKGELVSIPILKVVEQSYNPPKYKKVLNLESKMLDKAASKLNKSKENIKLEFGETIKKETSDLRDKIAVHYIFKEFNRNIGELLAKRDSEYYRHPPNYESLKQKIKKSRIIQIRQEYSNFGRKVDYNADSNTFLYYIDIDTIALRRELYIENNKEMVEKSREEGYKDGVPSEEYCLEYLEYHKILLNIKELKFNVEVENEGYKEIKFKFIDSAFSERKYAENLTVPKSFEIKEERLNKVYYTPDHGTSNSGCLTFFLFGLFLVWIWAMYTIFSSIKL